MIGRTAARLVVVGLFGLSITAMAHASRFAGRGAGSFAGAPAFHGGFHHFHNGGFHSRIFIGGTFFAPLYFPPPYYYPPAYYPPAYYAPATEYVEPAPAPAPAPAYWLLLLFGPRLLSLRAGVSRRLATGSAAAASAVGANRRALVYGETVISITS